MTTYAEFKAQYLEQVYRTGDTALSNAFDQLVLKAENLIRTAIRMNSLTKTYVTTSESAAIAKPDDYQQAQSFGITGQRPATVMPMQEYRRFMVGYSAADCGKHFADFAGSLYITAAPSASEPISVTLDYYYEPASYTTDPASPFYDDQPVLFEHALGHFVYDFLQDPQQSENKLAAFTSFVELLKHDQRHRRLPTAPLHVRPAGRVA